MGERHAYSVLECLTRRRGERNTNSRVASCLVQPIADEQIPNMGRVTFPVHQRLALAVGLSALAAVIPARLLQSQTPRADSTGRLVGIVLTKDGGVPLSYSVVSAPSLGRERFSNAEGVFTLADLPEGPLQLRVRHLGYSPVDLSVVIHAGVVDTVRVSLTHIAVRLTAMQVRGYPECKNPGAPNASADSSFATVFDQLHQNAEQYRLLTDAYPFVYAVERTQSRVLVNGDLRMDGIDTLVVNSNRWRYKPGSVITRTGRGRTASTMMNIPTLVNFADKAFLDNHCFYNGGLETVDGVELLRVDFIAASRIKDPDVDGSMYLDPTSLQIRRSVLRLTKVPSGLAGLVETEAVTQFGEVLPSIPVIADIASVNRFQTNAGRPLSDASANERQRLIRVQFVKGMPGDETKKPDVADPRPAHRTGAVPKVRHIATPSMKAAIASLSVVADAPTR